MDRDPLMLLISENIRSRMETLELDPAKLARRAGVNPTGVYDILSGKSRSPRVDTLAKIADALGVTLTYLIEEPSQADLRSEVTALFAQLPPDERRRMLVTMRAWLQDGQEEAS